MEKMLQAFMYEVNELYGELGGRGKGARWIAFVHSKRFPRRNEIEPYSFH